MPKLNDRGDDFNYFTVYDGITRLEKKYKCTKRTGSPKVKTTLPHSNKVFNDVTD
jgi:hypothetical protein